MINLHSFYNDITNQQNIQQFGNGNLVLNQVKTPRGGRAFRVVPTNDSRANAGGIRQALVEALAKEGLSQTAMGKISGFLLGGRNAPQVSNTPLSFRDAKMVMDFAANEIRANQAAKRAIAQNDNFIESLYNAVKDPSSDNVKFGFEVKYVTDGGRRRGVRLVKPNATLADGLRKALLTTLSRAGISSGTMRKIRSVIEGGQERISKDLAMEKPLTGKQLRQIFKLAMPESHSGIFRFVPLEDGVIPDQFDAPNKASLEEKKPAPKPKAKAQPKQKAVDMKELLYPQYGVDVRNDPFFKNPLKTVSEARAEDEARDCGLPSAHNAPLQADKDVLNLPSAETRSLKGKKWASALPAAKREEIAHAMARFAGTRYHLSTFEYSTVKQFLRKNPKIMDEMYTYANDKASQHALLDDVVDQALGAGRSNRRR